MFAEPTANAISTADQVRAKASPLITLLSWREVRRFEGGQRTCQTTDTGTCRPARLERSGAEKL
jgi:hypothetical protein